MLTSRSYLLFCFALLTVACSKNVDEINNVNLELSEECLADFFKYPRKSILSDSLLDNRHNWILEAHEDTFNVGILFCDSNQKTGAVIQHGLSLEAHCHPFNFARAILPLPEILPEYLGLEIGFKRFISKFHENVWIRQNELRVFAGEFVLDFANVPPASYFIMPFGGHSVHFLIPTRGLAGRKAFVFSDEFIPHTSDGMGKNEIKDSDISILARLEMKDTTNNYLSLVAHAMSSDNGFITESAVVEIDYIYIYEPVFPCK